VLFRSNDREAIVSHSGCFGLGCCGVPWSLPLNLWAANPSRIVRFSLPGGASAKSACCATTAAFPATWYQSNASHTSQNSRGVISLLQAPEITPPHCTRPGGGNPLTSTAERLSNKRELNDCSTSAPLQSTPNPYYPRPLAVRRACTVSGRSRLDPSPPSRAPARQKQC